MQYKNIYFFIGTTAELIKMMPVMHVCWRRGVPFQLVASGQNDIRNSELLGLFGKNRPDVILFEGNIRKSAASLLFWFFKTFFRSIGVLKKSMRAAPGPSVMVVHGDTVSTVMGAMLAKIHRMDVAHVEAGLRSFNYLHPFPEEIDRVITSRLANLHFCPNEWSLKNIRGLGGEKINTSENTLRDALAMAQASPAISSDPTLSIGRPYFVFVVHRQENLFNDRLVRSLVAKAIQQSKRDQCVFILHHLTEVALVRLGLLDVLKKEAGVTLMKRLPYMDFMRVLGGAKYVVTDGGSNQEECYYLGKPCLILRNVTERMEGIGHNAVLSKLDDSVIDEFLRDPSIHQRTPTPADFKASDLIVDRLAGIR
ncbi:UDP-N-acetylglucosamine 2-epimerase [Acidovorax sp. NCPPB 4044]|uniref:UDP-N-acetylglucosamine 2-epimerase n=1 Tax=Acidovorax sp. NCPPB 4044 TaxID=2940490 RepID=UPI0023039A21|nr:UDP-N-acetylglucosamine 2-epimerase [Acidovorax sp. NCPPB 4044]MDA8519449.1 UDP-N-acetylglucosamine 2-epimerase [Acidovorax sp. NCPPB 4044]